MSTRIFTITDAGRQEIVNASNTGTDKVEIAAVGVGSQYYKTLPTQTEIQSEIKRITTIGGAVVSPDTIHVSAKDESEDEYVVYTVGLYTGKGTLFAVYSQEAAIMQKTASTIMLLANDITFQSLDTGDITFGDVVFSNPPASETVAGIVRFADADEIAAGSDGRIAVSAKRLHEVTSKKANLDSPAMTGIPTVPTAPESSNGAQVANTAFVRLAIAALVGSSPEALDTLNELAAALDNDPNFATTVMNALAAKQPKDSTLSDLSGKDVPGLLEYLGLKGAAKCDVGTTAGTVAAGDDSRFGLMIGVGQSWQDVTGARAPAVTYTNSAGKPIMIFASVNINSTVPSATLSVNGVVTSIAAGSNWPTNFLIRQVMLAIVPAGATYRLDGGYSLANWTELR